MDKSAKVFESVRELYENSTIQMSKWMWNYHVQWVADKTKELAEKYGADTEKTYCAALLHDLGDAKYVRTEENFKNACEEIGTAVLLEAGFSEAEIKEIIEIIIRPHSCKPGNLPTTPEGKVLSTADALFHLQTSFFPMFCYKNRPETILTYENWQEWVDEKLEREFRVKIFFEDERAAAKADYDALSLVFRNKSLNSKEN
jgi:putative nucleotidyltransferase with HDIG domain